MADFAVNDNVFVDFDSHKINYDNAIFKPYEKSIGINTTAPTKALHSIGEFNLSAAGTQREVSVNATCVIIKGQTSTLEVC